MLQAQIYHKVPQEFEGMEDVLTSSTIGLLSYLPGPLAAEVVAELAQISMQDETIEVKLWPNYATPLGFRTNARPDDDFEEGDSVRGRTEPDAVLSGAGWLVVLEAKYHSSLDEEYDQLGREFAIGFAAAKENGLQYRLLVLTANTLEPKPAGMSLVQGVQQAVAKAQGRRDAEMVAAVPDSLRWTNWQRLYRILHTGAIDPRHPEHTRRLLGDACRLLQLRGLIPYDSKDIEKAMHGWLRGGIPDEAWTAPSIYRSDTVTSLGAGWRELMCLNTSGLGAPAWQPYTTIPYNQQPPTGRAVQLEDFTLDPLRSLAWQPYPQKGITP